MKCDIAGKSYRLGKKITQIGVGNIYEGMTLLWIPSTNHFIYSDIQGAMTYVYYRVLAITDIGSFPKRAGEKLITMGRINSHGLLENFVSTPTSFINQDLQHLICEDEML